MVTEVAAQLDRHQVRHDDGPHLLGLRGREDPLPGVDLHLPGHGHLPLVKLEPVAGHPEHLPDA